RSILWLSMLLEFIDGPLTETGAISPMTFATNRRASTRHAAANHQTILQIMDWTGQRVTRAKLLNISTEGALIRTDKVPVLKQPVRVRLENATEIGWIMAEPVRIGQSKEVGIRFCCPGPRAFLLAATL